MTRSFSACSSTASRMFCEAVELRRGGFAERVEVERVEERGRVRAGGVEDRGDAVELLRERLRDVGDDVFVADLRRVEAREVRAELVVVLRASEEDQLRAGLAREGEGGLEADAFAAAGDEQRVAVARGGAAVRRRVDGGGPDARLVADAVCVRRFAEIAGGFGFGGDAVDVELVEVDDAHGDVRPLDVQRAREAGAARRALHDDEALAVFDRRGTGGASRCRRRDRPSGGRRRCLCR